MIMKSVAILTTVAAACTTAAGASSALRGEWESGVEEVGEQIEHFPPENYDGMGYHRRVLIGDDGEVIDVTNLVQDEEDVGLMAERVMEEYFDGEDEYGMSSYDATFDAPSEWEEEELEDDEEAYMKYDPESLVFGTLIEDEDDEAEFYWEEDEEPVVKEEYTPEPDMITLEEGVDLLGNDIEDGYEIYERRLAACGANKAEVKIILKTDKYAYETSWKIVDTAKGNKVIAQGPPSGTNYADQRTYSGRWCLNPSRYEIRVLDKGRDGMCTGNPNTYGCGFFKVYLNGKRSGQVVNDKNRWTSKRFPINIAPVSSRIDGVNNQPKQQQWCKKVRSVMKVPSGTCTLPNGQRGHRVRVTTKVDKYGKETSWEIKRNGVTRMKMGPIVPANGQKAVEDCLPRGDYTFVIKDPDGICCRHGQGSFKVHVDGKPLFDGGAFVKSISHSFKLGFDWISSMNERDCEWWWAHDYRRRDWHTRCYAGKYCNKTYRHLKWNPSLKADAKVYAEKLLRTCNDVGIKHDVTDQGENLAKNKGNGKWGRLYEADLVTKRFVDNEEFWGWNKNAHLTQAMWYSSGYIGCADSVKNLGGDKLCRMQVCRYTKAGNCMMGKYNAGSGKNWMIPMMKDDSPCGPMCPTGGGCHN